MKSKPSPVAILILMVLCGVYTLLCYADEEEASGTHAGADKAVTEYSPHQGLQFSIEALKKLHLQFQKIEIGRESFQVPPAALVYFKDAVGVYRHRKGWFKLVEVKVISKTTNQVKIQTSDLQNQDEIVTQGIALLRVAELDAGGGGKNHGD